MNIDDLLHFLAPLTPAVLPVVVFIWYRTRRELREIRQELVALRQVPLPPDPRLEDLLQAVEAMSGEVARLAEDQRAAMRLVSEREPARARLEPGSSLLVTAALPPADWPRIASVAQVAEKPVRIARADRS